MVALLGSDLFTDLTMDPLFVKDSVELKLGLLLFVGRLRVCSKKIGWTRHRVPNPRVHLE